MPETRSKIRGGLKLYLKVFAPAFGALILLVALKYVTGNPISYFTRDPAATTGQPMYLGLFSNLGMVLWGLVAAVLCFTAVLIKKMEPSGRMRGFFLLAAITTSLLYLDDFFQLHEDVFPVYLHIPQLLVYLLYGVWILYFLVRYYHEIMQVDPMLLFISLAFFGISVGIDLIEDHIRLPAHHLSEDGCKFLGIVSWCVYFLRFSFDYLAESVLRRTVECSAPGSGPTF